MIGKRLCRSKGYFIYELDRPRREWLSRGLITLVQADDPQAY
ncbi:hypothetical protein [Antarctobacter heliothermus]|nr:hypothetical protein [Antarctobacter heliothermus]